MVGIVIGCDLWVKLNVGDIVVVIMILKDKLVIVCEGILLEEMKVKFYENCIEKMLVVDENFYLCGLVIFCDIEKVKIYLLVFKDE